MRRIDAMHRLATVWFTGAGFLFLLLFVQTLLGRYGDRVEDVWSWFAAVLVPVVTLIAGAFFSNKLGGSTGLEAVDSRVYGITLGMSVVYLIVVNASVLLSPFSSLSPLELMRFSELWLELFQGLLTMALGVFFIKQTTGGETSPASPGR